MTVFWLELSEEKLANLLASNRYWTAPGRRSR
jgi:hypothetical protein